LPTLRFAAAPRRTDGAGSFLLEKQPVQLPEVAIVDALQADVKVVDPSSQDRTRPSASL
jgi:hypothetical protein